MSTRITLIIMLNLLLNQVQTKTILRIIFDRVEAMEVSKESKLQVEDFHIYPSNNSYFQGQFQVSQDLISSKLKMIIEIFKCLVGEAPDTCEYLTTLKPPNTCLLLNAENTAWNTITDAFIPKLRCPVTKGLYVGDKLTFDASKWTMFPLDNWHFKLTSRIYEGDVLIFAIKTQTHHLRIH